MLHSLELDFPLGQASAIHVCCYYLLGIRTLLPSCICDLTKSWGGIGGTWLGLANVENDKLEYCGRCFLQIPDITTTVQFINNHLKINEEHTTTEGVALSVHG